jgi:hypothetical protein
MQNCVAYLAHSEWKERCSRLYKESNLLLKIAEHFHYRRSIKKQHYIPTEAENFILSSMYLRYMGSVW